MYHHKKRHSWPPFHSGKLQESGDGIDSDPFAYFISSAEDVEADAGISTKPRSRSLSPAIRRARKPLYKSSNRRSPTAKLKRWIERMEKQYFHRSSNDVLSPRIVLIEPRSLSPPVITPTVVPISPPLRGRHDARLTSSQRVGVNGRTPPRRPRVWREPSSEIWSVAEEDENVGLGISV